MLVAKHVAILTQHHSPYENQRHFFVFYLLLRFYMVFLQQFMGKGWSGLHNSDQGQGISHPMNSLDPFSPYPSNTHGSAPKKDFETVL